MSTNNAGDMGKKSDEQNMLYNSGSQRGAYTPLVGNSIFKGEAIEYE